MGTTPSYVELKVTSSNIEEETKVTINFTGELKVLKGKKYFLIYDSSIDCEFRAVIIYIALSVIKLINMVC